jgi:tetratricopeptide (TPR) repeat protein
MSAARGLLVTFSLSFAGMIGLAHSLAYNNVDPFPPLAVSLSSPVAQVADFVGIALGFRKLTADMAWVQTLLYYGTTEEGIDPEEAEKGGGVYPFFLSYCQRVARIDPNFKNVFYYGAGVLGWNLNRLDEAEELLKEGIQDHPKEWRFQQFLAALAFQKNHDVNKLVEFLKGFIEEKDCPNLLRSILANIYKKQKRYAESIRVWMIVYDTGDPLYLERASSQIKALYPLAQKQIGIKAH